MINWQDQQAQMDECALGYLIEWAAIDRQEMAMLAAENQLSDECALYWIGITARHYGVDRNFSVKLEAQRYSGLWEELKKVENLEGGVVATYNKFCDKLHERYNRNFPSAASKFLWMKFRNPIIIYDSLAYKWVRSQEWFPEKNFYESYSRVWKALFDGALAPSCCRAHLSASGTAHLSQSRQVTPRSWQL